MAKRLHKWTRAEKRWLASHADDGIAVVAELLDVTTSEVINEADELGIRIERVPSEGHVCPWCGSRVPESSTSWWKAGLCEACYQKHLHECREQRVREIAARKQNDLDRQHLKRWGHL